MKKYLINIKLLGLFSALLLSVGITQAVDLFRCAPVPLTVGWGPNKYFPEFDNPNRKISVAIKLPSLSENDTQIHTVPVVFNIYDDGKLVATYKREASYYNIRHLVVSGTTFQINKSEMGQFIINIDSGSLDFAPIDAQAFSGHSFESMDRSKYNFLTLKPAKCEYVKSIKEEPVEFKVEKK